ncbi:MAG: DUF1553 domain-containing protein, partial [Verrucomicrobiales bacterium]|nr:DUF1553 domain-containing protein [Verrucomicrobiales bacterium]
EIMPPPSSPKPLTKEERAVLRQWIDEGAEYQEHWSFQPIHHPQPPTPKKAEGARNSIDRFIRAKLDTHQLQPAPEADPATLIRRLSLDLTGLPPTPREVKKFERDCAKNDRAYDHLVTRLLASPHFGERWGRHWLDMARYADSNGFLGDGARPEAWRYRDWVIDSFNRDQPFDQFTIEQLAGDLLPEPTPSQLTATGFHRNAALNTEAGVDKELARFQNLADRVNTTGRVWLGFTLGCAQCHTHKYDPITIRDYYSFYAFFNNTQDKEQPGTKAQILAEVTKDRRQTYVHLGGDYARQGPDVVPASLSHLTPLKKATGTAEATRLDLARWMVSKNNPLTARVAVNHLWSRLFGTGLVATEDDFGTTGASPSHPELLDWLATEFIARGWSRKALIRLIVTSATYRQSAAHRDDLTEIDPLNRLLARQNRLRLEAEIVRDSALSVSGLLTPSIGGPSFRPPLPEDLFDVGRSKGWKASPGSERYRRSLYIITLRSTLYPLMTTFDAPDAAEACVHRDRTNSPLQALALLNEGVFIEAAEALAQRALTSPGQPLPFLFREILNRRPRAEELDRLKTFHTEQLRRFKANPQLAFDLTSEANLPPPPTFIEAAALTATARVLLNLDEFINRP